MTSALTIASHGRLASPSSLGIVSWGRLSGEAALVIAPPIFTRSFAPGRIERAVELQDEVPWLIEYIKLRRILLDDDEALIQQ